VDALPIVTVLNGSKFSFVATCNGLGEIALQLTPNLFISLSISIHCVITLYALGNNNNALGIFQPHSE